MFTITELLYFKVLIKIEFYGSVKCCDFQFRIRHFNSLCQLNFFRQGVEVCTFVNWNLACWNELIIAVSIYSWNCWTELNRPLKWVFKRPLSQLAKSVGLVLPTLMLCPGLWVQVWIHQTPVVVRGKTTYGSQRHHHELCDGIKLKTFFN